VAAARPDASRRMFGSVDWLAGEGRRRRLALLGALAAGDSPGHRSG
jgi:hypothetical protein